MAKRTRPLLILFALLLTFAATSLGCAGLLSKYANVKRVNIAQAAQLSLTRQVEIKQNDYSSSAGFQLKATITDQAAIDRFVEVLNKDLNVPDVALACVPSHLIEFSRSDGTLVTLAYLCKGSGQDDYFISAWASDGSFKLGGSVKATPGFAQLVEEAMKKGK